MAEHNGAAVTALKQHDPEQLGAYRLLGRLGHGGMGTVYLAENGRGQRFAVKVVNSELADMLSFRERFQREVTAARRVRRFCTAPVIDAELDTDPLYVVTEYIVGPNLDQRIKGGGPMPGSDLEQLAVGVATALIAIHGAGIVHRDLKPANVLLSALGPRVIDFGIARAMDTVTGVTRTGQLVGTPAYLAPEVIEGHEAGPAADVFAWACVVAFAGTGRAPFAADTVPAILHRISSGVPTLDNLDGDLRPLVELALAKDPAARPSAQELIDRLTGKPGADASDVAATIEQNWTPQTVDAAPTVGRTLLDSSTTMTGQRVLAESPRLTNPSTASEAILASAAPPRTPGRFTRSRRLRMGGGVFVACALGVTTVLLLRTGGSSDGPPASAGAIYSDDFSDPGSGWDGRNYTFSSDFGGTADGYQSGYYHMQLSSTDAVRTARAPYNGKLPSSFMMATDVRFGSDATRGVGEGRADVWCGAYNFLVRADGKGVIIKKIVDNVTKELATEPTAAGFQPGAVNHLQIACESKGSSIRLRLWIDQRLAVEGTDSDSPPPIGNVGLGIERTLVNTYDLPVVAADFTTFEIDRLGS